MMRGGRGYKHFSKERPSRSQLTNSDYLSRLYSIIDNNAFGDASDPDAIKDCVEGIANDVRELGDEQESKSDNMPDSLRDSSTGELLQERKDACDTCADELEAIDFEQDPEESFDDFKSRIEEEMQSALGDLESA